MAEVEHDALERFLGLSGYKARSPLTIREYRYDLILFLVIFCCGESGQARSNFNKYQ